MNSVPCLKDLQRYFIPQYCADWREIGVELGLSIHSLDEIKADNHGMVRKCCLEMLNKWLSTDLSATWKKLFHAIEPPIVSTVSKGEEVAIASYIV